MNILVLMIPMAILLGVGFVSAFLWATSKGQFDDLETPAHRILEKDSERKLL
ncbi:cbb3-type cytochrome oxidase assembly protein CcoS [Bdellovibrio sp. 22V]|uniref:cbb3-type cytochrome oxidase assembly protein CcoS n=1 Tax=Bdellovibrio TaxID=958 RepID=UPI002542B16E|nr:cbb3-type cytochrome oxidase assembly protein CcoS [Bdellovibrio sp. 22V]WII73654.1 cbb3-type cytochrome oxidase assembly protein CcoS [Bdellovibrio sp. 22V]